MTPIPPKTLALLQEEITHELSAQAAYLFLQTQLNYYGFIGLSKFMEKSAQDEGSHASKIINYLLDRGHLPAIIGSLDTMPTVSASYGYEMPLKCFSAAATLEAFVTSKINAIYQSALEEKDYGTVEFLNWFVREQVDSEKEINDIVRQLQLIGSDTGDLVNYDQEFAEED